MEEWKTYKLGEICTKIGSGATPKGGKEAYLGGDTSLIRSQNVLDFSFSWDGLAYINEDQASKLDGVEIERNDVLLNITGDSVARACIVPDDALPARVNQHVAIIRGNHSLVLNEYILCFLQFKKQNLLSLSQGGATRNALTKGMIENLDIHLPELSEQEKIVSILKSFDEKIGCNRRINDNLALSFLLLTCFVLWLLKRINDNLEQQAQALFKSWLSHCSKMVTIGDLSLNITDYTKCEREEVVLINSSDVTEGHFEHHILSENKNLKGHFKKRFQKGDILYSQVRPRNRHWAFCTFDSDNYLASTQLMVIRNRPNVIPSILLYQYIIDDNVWLEFTLKTETRSGTFPQGNYEDLSSIRVPFGADTQSISASLERIYNLIYCNEDESRRLAQLRDTLLPRLMSGELKVNEIEMH